jgi:hypothetical protein
MRANTIAHTYVYGHLHMSKLSHLPQAFCCTRTYRLILSQRYKHLAIEVVIFFKKNVSEVVMVGLFSKQQLCFLP